MNVRPFLLPALGLVLLSADARATLLTNGNLDQTQSVEIVSGFFQPKPAVWINDGSRTITGPYEDEMSSEPWAGPAPTPVTADGSGLPGPDGCGTGQFDCAVFFKPFTGNTPNGAMTGHLYQDVPGTPGLLYTLTGWAGTEVNMLGNPYFAIDFLDVGNAVISSAVLDLIAAGLYADNGEPFDYKQYSVNGVAPAGTATVRARVTLTNAIGNPLGGGQAFVVDDFELTDGTVPEPATVLLTGAGLAGLFLLRRRRA